VVGRARAREPQARIAAYALVDAFLDRVATDSNLPRTPADVE
jgi:hypothetical protein